MLDIEKLENRKLLTSTLTASGILRIVGTSGNDSVSVSLQTATVISASANGGTQTLRVPQILVTEGSVSQTYLISEVRRISWAGGAGDDLITLGRVNVPTFFNGGAGDDSISASRGDKGDSMYGGEGDDYLFGGAGGDILDGGNGGDVMFGNAGNDFIQVKSEISTDDVVSGGTGVDTVSLSTYQQGTTSIVGVLRPGVQLVTDGIKGDIERFIGSGFNDRITNDSGHVLYVDGGAGNDVILMGTGNDTLIGGAGRDYLSGGPGNDTILAQDGQVDTILGGTGDDAVTRDPGDAV